MTSTGNCPLTPGYWKNHGTEVTNLLSAAKGGAIYLGTYKVDTYAKAKAVFDAMNCGSSTSQGAAGCLAGHLLATELNQRNGAATSCIVSSISAADAFLVSVNYQGPTVSVTMTATQRTNAINIKNALDTYNNHVGCV